jgi:hypothetical protein
MTQKRKPDMLSWRHIYNENYNSSSDISRQVDRIRIEVSLETKTSTAVFHDRLKQLGCLLVVVVVLLLLFLTLGACGADAACDGVAGTDISSVTGVILDVGVCQMLARSEEGRSVGKPVVTAGILARTVTVIIRT